MKTICIAHIYETKKGGIDTYINLLKTLNYIDLQIVHKESSSKIVALFNSFLNVRYSSICRLFISFLIFIDALIIISRNQCDVVYLHSFYATIWFRIFRFYRSRIVYCPHGWAFDAKSGIVGGFARFFESKLNGFCKTIVCISKYEYDRAIAVGISIEKLCLIKSAVIDSASDFCSSIPVRCSDDRRLAVSCIESSPPIRVAFVGRYDVQKGFDIFLKCAERFKGNNDYQFHSVGSPIVNVREFRAESCVIDHGWLDNDDVRRFLLQTDLVVMPSRWEGFGLVAIEAMCAGKPVIVSDVGGLSELVDDNVNGFKCKVDSVESFVHAICAYDRNLLKLHGQNARSKFLKHYSFPRFSRDYYQLLLEFVGNTPCK